MPSSDGGLGSHLVGDKINIGQKTFYVSKLLGEGGFSYVYLVKEYVEGTVLTTSLHLPGTKDDNEAKKNTNSKEGASGGATSALPIPEKTPLVLKVTSIHSRAQRDIAEKEAKLLSRLSHPSIIKMYDTRYRTVAHQPVKRGKEATTAPKERPQHLILMEYCEGGHALDVCTALSEAGQRFGLSELILAFGQICNAVSYLHAQHPPIVHRDLKPVNFLVKNGAYKLCDFGSAVFGHVDLRTQKARAEAEEVIQKTTTQMFRAPEMVDLYMAKKLTQATDVWALGCCLYSLAFLQNCFEEGSNLAILSRKYVIPDDNPYGDGLVELLDRMLTVDSKARADMTEVILCLSAVYSGKPLPPRKRASKAQKKEKEGEANKEGDAKKKKPERVGTFRTDGQGVQETIYDPTKVTEAKKLNPNSAAARRRRAAAGAQPGAKPPTAPTSTTTPMPATATTPAGSGDVEFSSFHSRFSEKSDSAEVDQNLAFSVGDNPFGDIKAFEGASDSKTNDFFGAFDDAKKAEGSSDAFAAFDNTAWGDAMPDSSSSKHDAVFANNTTSPDPEGSEPLNSEGVEVGIDGQTDDQAKRDSPDSARQERSRRRRGETQRKGRGTGVEGGVENLSLNQVEGGSGDLPNPSADSADGGGGASGSDKKDRSRSSRRRDKSEDDKEHRRRRSGSRSKRKARFPRSGDGKNNNNSIDDSTSSSGAATPAPAPAPAETTSRKNSSEKSSKGPKRSSSFRNMFNRGSKDP